MKAIVCTKYGPPEILQLQEIEKPTPRDNEVLVKVYASSVNYNNLAHVRGEPFLARFWVGLLKPKYKVPGGDIAGRVESIGRNVTLFQPGNDVYGDLSACGYGAYAEYVCVPENVLALKPANISFEEAAAGAQAAVVALQGLRNQGQIKKEQMVLVYGASGGIGTFAVQIAKSFGAEVTGVCSTRNLDLVHSIGADQVIDYTRNDFTKNGQKYDLIIATAGYRSIFDYKRALRPSGIYVATGGAMAQIFQALLLGPLISMTGNKKMVMLTAKLNQKDLVFMNELFESGKVKSVINRRYPLKEIAEALRYYAGGHARGKVVITVANNIKT